MSAPELRFAATTISYHLRDLDLHSLVSRRLAKRDVGYAYSSPFCKVLDKTAQPENKSDDATELQCTSATCLYVERRKIVACPKLPGSFAIAAAVKISESSELHLRKVAVPLHWWGTIRGVP
jgi:hypothetical protein